MLFSSFIFKPINKRVKSLKNILINKYFWNTKLSFIISLIIIFLYITRKISPTLFCNLILGRSISIFLSSFCLIPTTVVPVAFKNNWFLKLCEFIKAKIYQGLTIFLLNRNRKSLWLKIALIGLVIKYTSPKGASDVIKISPGSMSPSFIQRLYKDSLP